MSYYITQADIEARVSARVFRQILDDDRNGIADTANVTRLIEDAEAYVEGFLRGVYVLEAVRAAPPNEVVRHCLEVAVCYLKDRFQTYTRNVIAKGWERVDLELRQLRTGERRLDVTGSPEPAANEGGVVEQGVAVGVNENDEPRLFDLGTTGFF